MVPPSRIELEINPYHGHVMPFNYRGLKTNCILLIITHFFQIIALIFWLIWFISNSGIFMGIHYDYKSTKSAKLMEKQAKREKKLAEKKEKRLAKDGPKKDEVKVKTLDASKPITLDFITNPNKEWILKRKMSV